MSIQSCFNGDRHQHHLYFVYSFLFFVFAPLDFIGSRGPLTELIFDLIPNATAPRWQSLCKIKRVNQKDINQIIFLHCINIRIVTILHKMFLKPTWFLNSTCSNTTRKKKYGLKKRSQRYFISWCQCADFARLKCLECQQLQGLGAHWQCCKLRQSDKMTKYGTAAQHHTMPPNFTHHTILQNASNKGHNTQTPSKKCTKMAQRKKTVK